MTDQPSNLMQEQRGLSKVQLICAEMHAIWRPTSAHDLGVDGQIEFIETGSSVSTGYILAVQLKSGPSYFQREREGAIEFYAKEKHRRYWSRLNIPVILVLHNPDADLTIYTRVKPQLKNAGPILVSLADRFSGQARDALLTAAKVDLAPTLPNQVLEDLKRITFQLDSGEIISGIHFLLSSVDPKITYLEIRMGRLLSLVGVITGQPGLSYGSEFLAFLHRCVLKSWIYQLSEPFMLEFEAMWYEVGMVPDIASELTPFGATVVEHLWANLDRYLPGLATGNGLSEVTKLAMEISATAQTASEQIDRSERLGEVPRV